MAQGQFPWLAVVVVRGTAALEPVLRGDGRRSELGADGLELPDLEHGPWVDPDRTIRTMSLHLPAEHRRRRRDGRPHPARSRAGGGCADRSLPLGRLHRPRHDGLPVDDGALIRLKAPLRRLRSGSPPRRRPGSPRRPPRRRSPVGPRTGGGPSLHSYRGQLRLDPDRRRPRLHGGIRCRVVECGICARAPGAGSSSEGPCSGDRGSPFAVQDRTGSWVRSASSASPPVPQVVRRMYTPACRSLGLGQDGHRLRPVRRAGAVRRRAAPQLHAQAPSLASIVSSMQARPASPSFMIRRFAASSAWRRTAGATDRLYRAAFGRGADTGP